MNVPLELLGFWVNIKKNIHKPPCIGLDESADVSDDAQLLVYVRFFNEEKKITCIYY